MRGPLPGTVAVPSPARPLGAGGHEGERRQLPVPYMPGPCPARALPALSVPCLCPSRPTCPHPLTCGAARLRHPLRTRLLLQLLPGDPAGRERLRLAPPGPRGTAGEEKEGKGIGGR